MPDQFSRTELIFGKEGLNKLHDAAVAVFGVGGVGGYSVEALARSGIGRIDLFDNDKFCLTNLNRQLYATRKTIGMYKVDVAKERLFDIDPDIVVNTYKIFYLPDTSDQVDLSQYDYIIDAIDTVTGKIELVIKAGESGVPIISSMGTGNKIDPTAFRVADIYDTQICPLAKVMRKELRCRGIEKLKVVYSEEPAIAPQEDIAENEKADSGKQVPGSNAFVPAVAGLIIAGEVVKDLIGR